MANGSHAPVVGLSANLLRNSMQAKAQSHEAATRDELFGGGGAAVRQLTASAPAAVDGYPPAQPMARLAARSHQQRRRRRNQPTAGLLDYSRWTRRTESRALLPILSCSASSSAEDLRPVDATPAGTTAFSDGSSADARRGGGESADTAARSQRAKTPPPPQGLDNDEELADDQRVELAIKAVKRLEGSLLREIHEIKERHKTLEALTLTRARAAKNESSAAAVGSKKRARAAAGVAVSLLPAVQQRQSRLKQAPLLRDRTLDSSPAPPRGSFKPETAALPSSGVAWTIRSLSPGAASKRPHGGWRAPPPVSAKTGAYRSRQQWTDLDLGSAYFLPPSVTEAKTPIEAALRLQKVFTELSLFDRANKSGALVSGNV